MMRVVILIFAIQLMEKINDFSRTLLLAIFFQFQAVKPNLTYC